MADHRNLFLDWRGTLIERTSFFWQKRLNRSFSNSTSNVSTILNFSIIASTGEILDFSLIIIRDLPV